MLYIFLYFDFFDCLSFRCQLRVEILSQQYFLETWGNVYFLAEFITLRKPFLTKELKYWEKCSKRLFFPLSCMMDAWLKS